MTKTQAKQLVVCVENDGYAVSLEKRKIYVALRDAAADKHNMLRIVDESGEDYLYPKAFFRSIALPQAVRRAMLRRSPQGGLAQRVRANDASRLGRTTI
jgi:hypothetical protein